MDSSPPPPPPTNLNAPATLKRKPPTVTVTTGPGGTVKRRRPGPLPYTAGNTRVGVARPHLEAVETFLKRWAIAPMYELLRYVREDRLVNRLELATDGAAPLNQPFATTNHGSLVMLRTTDGPQPGLQTESMTRKVTRDMLAMGARPLVVLLTHTGRCMIVHLVTLEELRDQEQIRRHQEPRVADCLARVTILPADHSGGAGRQEFTAHAPGLALVRLYAAEHLPHVARFLVLAGFLCRRGQLDSEELHDRVLLAFDYGAGTRGDVVPAWRLVLSPRVRSPTASGARPLNVFLFNADTARLCVWRADGGADCARASTSRAPPPAPDDVTFTVCSYIRPGPEDVADASYYRTHAHLALVADEPRGFAHPTILIAAVRHVNGTPAAADVAYRVVQLDALVVWAELRANYRFSVTVRRVDWATGDVRLLVKMAPRLDVQHIDARVADQLFYAHADFAAGAPDKTALRVGPMVRVAADALRVCAPLMRRYLLFEDPLMVAHELLEPERGLHTASRPTVASAAEAQRFVHYVLTSVSLYWLLGNDAAPHTLNLQAMPALRAELHDSICATVGADPADHTYAAAEPAQLPPSGVHLELARYVRLDAHTWCPHVELVRGRHWLAHKCIEGPAAPTKRVRAAANEWDDPALKFANDTLVVPYRAPDAPLDSALFERLIAATRFTKDDELCFWRLQLEPRVMCA